MYHIALCDDNQYEMELLLELVQESPFFTSAMVLQRFNSGFELLDEKNHIFDLVIIDLNMPGLDGYKCAKKYRESNPNTVIGLCSSLVAPRAEHFEVTPYRYVDRRESKSFQKKAIADLLCEMIRTKKEIIIEVTQDGCGIRLNKDEILYICKAKRGSKITLEKNSILYDKTDNSEMKIRESFYELSNALSSKGFSQPHSSFLVNIEKVKEINDSSITMKNGEIINLTRKMKNEFVQAFSLFFSHKYRRIK